MPFSEKIKAANTHQKLQSNLSMARPEGGKEPRTENGVSGSL